MTSRIVRAVGALILALGWASSPPVSAQPTAATQVPIKVWAPKVFSPNGDGTLDRARVTITLDRARPIQVQINRWGAKDVLEVQLTGKAGRNTWTWDGRAGGKVVADADYRIRVVSPGVPAQERWVRVDTAFDGKDATVRAGAGFRLPKGRALPVYPRTAVVRDALDLWPSVYGPVRRVALVIKGPDGRTVLRRDLSDYVDKGSSMPPPFRWTGRRAGRPLPPGRYTAFVAGTDAAGNSGRWGEARLWVSQEALVWHEETHVVTPQATRFSSCRFSDANGCGDFPPCGEVTETTRFAGGLTYASKRCEGPRTIEEPRAWSGHYVPLPQTRGIRGVHSAKVAFTGAATVAGAPDTGTISLFDYSVDNMWAAPWAVTSATGAETPVVEHPYLSEGYWGRFSSDPPGVAWFFGTEGTHSFDVEEFTLTVRYLAPAAQES